MVKLNEVLRIVSLGRAITRQTSTEEDDTIMMMLLPEEHKSRTHGTTLVFIHPFVVLPPLYIVVQNTSMLYFIIVYTDRFLAFSRV